MQRAVLFALVPLSTWMSIGGGTPVPFSVIVLWTPLTVTSSTQLWVPATMFTCMLTGLLVIVGNYLELMPGGKVQNGNLFLGLGLLIAGFVLSTQYR